MPYSCNVYEPDMLFESQKREPYLGDLPQQQEVRP
jgi:hypothetical protein